MKRPCGVMKSVNRKFKSLSTTKLAQLKTSHLKKRTFSKMQWGVRAYNEWRKAKLDDIVNFDVKVFEADLSMHCISSYQK